MNDSMLEIKALRAEVEGKEILKGVDLSIRPGEVHVIMGPNGAGKSTLGAVLAGRPGYTVTQGSVTYQGADLLAMAPEERSWAGIFLGFQQMQRDPVEPLAQREICVREFPAGHNSVFTLPVIQMRLPSSGENIIRS